MGGGIACIHNIIHKDETNMQWVGALEIWKFSIISGVWQENL